MFDYFINYSSNAHQVWCEDSPTKGLYDNCQSDDLNLYSKSQERLKLDYFLTCNILIYIYIYISYYIQTWHDGKPYGCHICSCSIRWHWLWYKVTVSLQRYNKKSMLNVSKQYALNLLQRLAMFYATLTLPTFIWLDQLVVVVVVKYHLGVSRHKMKHSLIIKFIDN